MSLPGCPKCGNAPNPATKHGEAFVSPWCDVCGFGDPDEDDALYVDADRANAAWTRAVTRELAEQALTLRNAGVIADHRDNDSKVCIMTMRLAQSTVMEDYAWLCANPLTLGGNDG